MRTIGFIVMIALLAACCLACLAFLLLARMRRNKKLIQEPLTDDEIVEALRARGLSRMEERDWRQLGSPPQRAYAPSTLWQPPDFNPQAFAVRGGLSSAGAFGLQCREK